MFHRTSTLKTTHDHSHTHSHAHSSHHTHNDSPVIIDHPMAMPESLHEHSLPKVPEDPHGFRPEVSVRYHSVAGFLWHWNGSITEHTWPKVLAFGVYLMAVSLTFSFGCDSGEEAYFSTRCKFGRESVANGLAGIFALWMAFTAFLFTSFVNAGLDRFRYSLNICLPLLSAVAPEPPVLVSLLGVVVSMSLLYYIRIIVSL